MHKCFVLILLSINLFSQKSKILINNNIKHNYPLGRVYIIEKPFDTSKLLFAGEVSIETGTRCDRIQASLQRLEFRCKEISSNSYKLKSYQIVDTTLSMIFSCYFINEVQAQQMKLQKVNKQLFILHSSYDTLVRKIVINGKTVSLYQDSIISISVQNKCNLILKTAQESEQPINKKLNADKEAMFIYIGFKKNYFYGAIPVAAWYLTNKFILHTFETFYDLDYNTGRLLLDLFPIAKEISIP